MSNKPIDYRALFDGDLNSSSSALAHELKDLLTVQPAPNEYRERLYHQLLAAASDENFYRRAVSRRFLFAASVVVSVLLSVVGFITWRIIGQRVRRAHASS